MKVGALAAAALSAAVGVSGIVGWVTATPVFVCFSSRSFPLQFNTAVCILLLGIGTAAAVQRRVLMAGATSAIVLAIVTLSGIRIFLGWGVETSATFFDASRVPIAQAPLAPNTVVALWFAAVGLSALATGSGRRAAGTVAAIVGAGIAAVGAIPVTGYAMGLSTAYQWGGKTPMSLPAALGALFIGVAIVAATWSFDGREGKSFPQWVAAAVLTGFATASVLLYSALQLDPSLTRTWSVDVERSVRINTLVTLVFGLGTSAVLAFAVVLARRNFVRSRELEQANVALDAEIGQRIAAHERAERLNRALRTVSSCRQAIAHASDETELLGHICDIAVEAGGYRLVWVGFAEEDEHRTVRPVARSGVAIGYLADTFVSWAEKDPRARGPTGTAVRSCRPTVCHDTLTDADFLPWRERALQFGLRSSLVTPLLKEGKAFGAVSIYSPTPNAFDADEVGLFTQLADDLASGIEMLRTRAKRAQAEAALAASEERYRSLAVATAQIVWITDANGFVHGDMPMWREFTGMSWEEIQGGGWLNSLHPEDRAHTSRAWLDAVERRSLYETEYRIRRADGEYRHVWVRGVPVVKENGEVREWVGTCTDITERKRAQEELARYAEELKRSNTELQEFAFVASHDLQEPLRKITAFSERLRDRCGAQLDDTGLDFLHRMHNAAMRMARLIDSLLEYSRLATRALPFEEVDLAATCVGVIADLEQRIRETGARVKVRQLPRLVGDPIQLRQLLQNLLANALKFHAPGKTPGVAVWAAQDDGRWRVSVSDNGIGFEPQFTDRIFRPFQRLHGRNEYEGSGMGLAICRKIAQRHGATFEVESEPGRGSTFTIVFPATQKRTEPCLTETQYESSSPRMMTTTTC